MPKPFKFEPLPPKEAIAYFQSKGYQIGFDWRDVWQEEHAYAFTVAKAARLDILQDIRTAVDAALADGVPFKDFAKNLKPALEQKGWWGVKEMVDPLTGEKKEVQLGSARRLKTIYDTNLRSAHAAGHWEKIQRVKKTRPYLRYVSVMDGRERPQHRAWHDIVLPVDHPFWQKFYPPNGWGCRCSVQQLSERDLKRLGLSITPDDQLPKKTKSYVNGRTGEVMKIPEGISPGFNFNIGQARMRAMVPPSQDRPLSVPFTGSPSKVMMPDPRRASKDRLYPDGLADEEYVSRFLKEFGADMNKSVIFTDVASEDIVISDALFKTASGRWKISKDLRSRYLGVLADTIKNPDEIWHVWEEYPQNRWTLRRKYMARWDIDGKDEPGFVLFHVGSDGWEGVTAFKPKKSKYLEKQRSGALVYQRKIK